MVDSGCRTCGGTGWVDIPHPTTPTMQVCPCDRTTPPPTPATEEREAVALVAYYARRGADDLGAGEVERLLEAAQSLAAEILAAEARGMGRARTVVQNTRDGMKFDPSATLEWRNAITGGFNAADLALRHELDAIERGEHGAGK